MSAARADGDSSALIRLTAPHAVCLDGGPAGYYYRPGRGEGASKWSIHHEGGGWCQLEKPYQSWPNDNCVDRASTRLGTLKNDSATAAWNMTLGCAGCSTDPSINPLMHNWNSVYLRYCDGGAFSGSRPSPLSVNGTMLYFKGAYVREAVVADLRQRMGSHFTAATDAVIGGSSAGGLAVYLHVDWWREQLPTSATVVGLADSGFFLDWNATRPTQATHSFDDDLRSNFALMESSKGVNQACVAAHHDAPSDCAFASAVLPHTSTPLFVLQSAFDSWQLQWEHGEARKPDYAALNAYGAQLTQALRLASGQRDRVGGFVERCYHHCTTRTLWSAAPTIGGLPAVSAFSRAGGAAAGVEERGGGSSGVLPGTLWQEGALPCQECGCPNATLCPDFPSCGEAPLG